MYIVDASGGDDFGELTLEGIEGMSAMLAVCFDDYGAKTASRYCSYYELRTANDRDKPIIPLRLSDKWPPVPPSNDEDGKGARLNAHVFSPSLAWLDGRNKTPAECATLLLEKAADKLPRS